MWLPEETVALRFPDRETKVHKRHLMDLKCKCGNGWSEGGHLVIRKDGSIAGYECTRCKWKREITEGASDLEALPVAEDEGEGVAAHGEAFAG